ncbi:MAG: uroporphyrinogen-III C-methyltransferase [Bacteroidales bacterium]|nr:uroporphyrinogen-III C-methyltransferase [Bacteroidales bacterium]
MSFLPISINIKNKKILIVGGGHVGLRKLQGLQSFAAKITILSPVFHKDIAKYNDIETITASYKKEYLKDFFLVYACTNSELVNRQVYEDSASLGILCNRTDNAVESGFHSSAIVETDNLIMGVNSKNHDRKGLLSSRDDIQLYVNEREQLQKTKAQQKGRIYLVGFGPGNPDLLTKRGEQLLYQADVICYDDLLDANALSRYSARKIYVGKRRDNHSKQQHEINEILYQLAMEGNMVVRLKGGDPLIFGRGSEERFFLEERGFHVEIVPGISSAVAAAAYGNIPLTHRGISSSVAFGTAHGRNSYKILEADTSVYYMGAKNMVEIARKYLERGYSPSFPVGIIHNVSMPDQEVIKTTVSEVAEGSINIESPVILIFGNTVNYQSILRDGEEGKAL